MRVTVKIGRNVGTEPLPPLRWLSFISNTAEVIDATDLEFGRGEWDGVGEDNATLHGTAEADEWGPWRIWAPLAQLAGNFGQDAIAVLLEGADRWVLAKPDGTTELGWEA